MKRTLKRRGLLVAMGWALAMGLPSISQADHHIDRPYWFLLGANAGYSTLSTTVANEPGKSGYEFDLRGVLSYLSENWVYDLGLGWSYNRLSGELNGLDKRITTRSAFIEFVPRYRFDHNWQFGPLLQLRFGTDVGFSDSSAVSGKKSTALLGGLRVDYEFHHESRPLMRIGGHVATDLDIKNRSIYLVMLDFQIGWDIFSRREPAETVAASPAPRVVAPEPRISRVQVIDKHSVRLTLLEGQGIYFETGSAKLSASSQAYLKRVAEFLKANPTAWKTVMIDGHTDIRGRRQYNVDLSFKRAKAVREVFVANGISTQQLKPKGYGPDKPLDARNIAEAWAKNRRVELKFTGVKNANSFGDSLNEIKLESVE